MQTKRKPEWAIRDAKFFPAPASKPATATETQKNFDGDFGDTLLAFHEQRKATWMLQSPDVALRVAVLEDAYRIMAHGERYAKHLKGAYNDTLAWVLGNYKSHKGFSLEDICDLLDLDYRYVRKKLLELSGGDTRQIHFPQRRVTHRMQTISKNAVRLPKRKNAPVGPVLAKRSLR